MRILQSIKNLFSKRKPYTMPERNTAMPANEFRQALERSARQREMEREWIRLRYEMYEAYSTPPRPITTTFDEWTSTTAATTSPYTTGTYREPDTWRMGPTVNPFTRRFPAGRPEYSEPLPKYQILSTSISDDPLNQTARIAIDGIGTFSVSTGELINNNIEDLVRRLVKMGPKKAVHIVVIGVISV